MARTDARIALLLEVMDKAFDGRGWHGTTLKGSLKGVRAGDALVRPAPGRLRIWDLVLHAAYWKWEVRQRFIGDGIEPFPRSPANFPTVPDAPDEKRWKADVALLVAEHRKLRKVVERMPPALLGKPARKSWRRAEEIHGIAAHDAYHTGQIQLIKALMR